MGRLKINDTLVQYMIDLLTSEPIQAMAIAFKHKYQQSPKARSHYKLKTEELCDLIKALQEHKEKIEEEYQ